jgi:hypothetical protein
MRPLSRRTAIRAIGVAAILAGSTSLSGCVVPPGENLADVYEDWAGFCGFLQYCGSDSDGNRGGVLNDTDETGSSGSGSSGSTGSAPIGD